MLYMAYSRRKAVESAEDRKNLMLAAFTSGVYGNTNYDSEENSGKRQEAIREMTDVLEENFLETIRVIYGGKTEFQILEEAAANDPFFLAIKLPYQQD